jgi:hypothetical protein
MGQQKLAHFRLLLVKFHCYENQLDVPLFV